MSRYGHSEDCEGWDLIRWRGAVNQAIPLPSFLKWKNGGVPCDMLTGACACGATHTAEERVGLLNDECDEELLRLINEHLRTPHPSTAK